MLRCQEMILQSAYLAQSLTRSPFPPNVSCFHFQMPKVPGPAHVCPHHPNSKNIRSWCDEKLIFLGPFTITLKFLKKVSMIFTSKTKHNFVPLGLETFCSFEHLEKMVNPVGANQNVTGVCLHQKAVWGPGVYLQTYKYG